MSLPEIKLCLSPAFNTHTHTQLHLTPIGIFFSPPSFIPFISLEDAEQTVQRSMWLGTSRSSSSSSSTAARDLFPLSVQGGTVRALKKNLSLHSHDEEVRF